MARPASLTWNAAGRRSSRQMPCSARPRWRGSLELPIYIVHTSSQEALEAALLLRGAAPTCIETCPQYLTHDIGWAGGDVGKINPPLREACRPRGAVEGIRNGSVNTVATDHVHRDVSSKAGGIWAASPGCPGLDTLLPVMLSEGHHKRGIPLPRIVELLATNPARIMGLGHAKGAIAVGLDADLAIVDMNGTTEVLSVKTLSSAGYSIYDGWKLKVRVVHTLVRGASAMRDGTLDDSCVGRGRYVYRRLAA